MKTAMTIVMMLIRLSGLALIVLGALFWTGHAYSLLPEHMLLGLVFVLLLWGLAPLAIGRGGDRGLAVLVVLWGAFVVALGTMQRRLLVGDSHWIVQVLHLLVGVAALALAERLAASAKRNSAQK